MRRHLLSHLQYYHRLKALNYCVRDGNRCDHFDMFAGKAHRSLFTCDDLDLFRNRKVPRQWFDIDDNQVTLSGVYQDHC